MMDDNRVVFFELYGKQYPLCCTVSAKAKIDEKWGSLDAWAELVEEHGEDVFALAVEMTKILMDGGAAHMRVQSKISGEEIELPTELSLDELCNLIPVLDCPVLMTRLSDALTAGQHVTVEIEPEKNGETTQ